MLIVLNDDRAYLAWLAHHRAGYVLDGRRRPKLGQLVLHRAACDSVRPQAGSRRHWTTGVKLKACALDRDELVHWAEEETGLEPQFCPACAPQETPPAEAVHLTRLERDLVDFVLDAALVHLEPDSPPYRLTVGDIAACFAKTPGQLAGPLERLEAGGWLTLEAAGTRGPAASCRVLPTPQALRSLEAFQTASDAMIQADLASLTDRAPQAGAQRR